jgi:protein-L-isoaspartate(D-aspartate) O-methyltransferase
LFQEIGMIDFERARKVMVDNQLRTSGITDRRVLAAMSEIAREKFLPAVRQGLAYIDEAQPLNRTRRLGAPAPFARLVQLAAIEHEDRVLDLGCGTGYSSAVLARLAASVVAVDDDPVLASTAKGNLAALGVNNVTVIEGALARAAKDHGPFDVVLVEGELDSVPEAFLAQLKPDGRLVALIAADGRPPVAHLFVRSGKGVASSAAFDAHLPPFSRPADPGFEF